MTKKVRSSNFELLRIFAMTSIILYHCLSEYAPKVEDERLALSMYYILHWGVPVFLLISGFFSVKFSVKKIIHFWLYCAIWMIISYLLSCAMGFRQFDVHSFGTCFLPISHSTLWFVPFYFWLIILSPLLNPALAQMDDRKLFITLIVLLSATLYFSFIWNSKIIQAGKSIIYFICIYVLGAFLRRCVSKKNLSLRTLLLCEGVFIITVIVASFILPFHHLKIVQKLVFYYVSPGLILSAVLLFLIFSRIKIQSRLINYVAESAFAIYLFHENCWSHDFFYGIVHKILSTCNDMERLGCLLCFVVAVSLCVVVVDKLVRKPITLLVMRLIEKVDFSGRLKKRLNSKLSW